MLKVAILLASVCAANAFLPMGPMGARAPALNIASKSAARVQPMKLRMQIDPAMLTAAYPQPLVDGVTGNYLVI
jgi:hypothetical protein